ncbi:MAG: permease [Thermoplasmatales archaeon]|nr:permease [Thermoplasmatales archaeon]
MKFRKKHHDHDPSCGSCCHTPKKWYKERLFIVVIILIVFLIISYFTPALKDFYGSFKDYASIMWLPVIVGFLIGGIIDYFIPKEYIEKYLSRHRKRTIVYAIMFGFLMTACCHGILAIGIELYRKGASTSAIVAFFLASPWANLPITVLLFGFFGPKAIFIVVSALIIAFVTGLIFLKLEKRGWVECDKCQNGEDTPIHEDFSITQDIRRRVREYKFTKTNLKKAFKGTISGSWTLAKMVLWWILIGMTFAAIANAYIPAHLFVTYMGPSLLGLFVTLLLATIIEVCSEGSSPLSFEIYNQTGAFGNSFTFLMAGVVTDYTEIGLIWQNIGKKAALWIPVITIPQVLILSHIFNTFL